MSSSIWTQCAGGSDTRLRLRHLRLSPWRVVESQYRISTRKLVDSLEEQALLEQMIEASKPAEAFGPRVHVLLSTPFRYPPLRHGSRFGARHELGVWYGSETQRTLFAEAAYYRLVFLDGTRANLGAVTTSHTAFTVGVRTDRGLDLTLPPFASHRATLASPVDYLETQALGREMRAAAIEAFRYPSARDAEPGVNVGVLTPVAFGAARPRQFETWHGIATRARVEFVKQDFLGPVAFTFPRGQFLVDGVLPAPAF